MKEHLKKSMFGCQVVTRLRAIILVLLGAQVVCLEVLARDVAVQEAAQVVNVRGERELIEVLIVLVLCVVLVILKWQDRGVSVRNKVTSLLEWRPAPRRVRVHRAEFSLEQYRLTREAPRTTGSFPLPRP